MPDAASTKNASPDQVGPIDIPDLKQAKSAADDPVARYVEMLRGGHGTDPSASAPGARTTGFVFAVRAAESLQPLQDASPHHTPDSLFCLTLRYRIKSGAVLGTLLTALLHDLNAIRKGATNLLGIASPETTTPEWRHLAESPLAKFAEAREAAGPGRLDEGAISELLRLLGNDEVLPWGARLVLFAEIVGAESDQHLAEEWKTAASTLWGQLPYRLGLGFSGVPDGFTLRAPAMLVATLGAALAVQTADGAEVQYRASGLVADRATSADHLGRAKLAASTAEFLLHTNTAPPFTVGLFGAWGKGKSSFIEQLNLQLRDRASGIMQFELPGGPAFTLGQRWRRAWMALRVESQRLRLLFARSAGNRARIKGRKRLAAEELRVGRLWSATRELPAARGGPLLPRLRANLLRWRASRATAAHKALILADQQRSKAERTRVERAMQRLADWRIVTVTFNAWQFEDAKQTWAGLASVISERIEDALPWWRRLWLRVLYAWRNYRGELILNVGLPVALLVLGAAVIAISPGLQDKLRGLVESKTTDSPAVKLARSILPAASATILALLGWWRLAEGVKPLSERLMAYAQRPDYRGEMGYQHQVIEDLRFLLRQLQRARPGCRVLVHVDDLDRCSDEKVVELLRATNLVLAACDLFVLLAVDDGMLRKAIETQKKGDPDNYLRKIVQISLFLPSTQADARLEMVSQFFSDATRDAWSRSGAAGAKEEAEKKQGDGDAGAGADGLAYDLATVLPARRVEEVVDTREELAAMHDCREYLPDNARELKRLVNTHRFVKILLSGSAGWSDQRQRALVKWLVFCANWPDLVDDVLAFAAASPTPDDCLAQVQHAYAGDERLAKFIAIAPPLAPEDLRGDFAVAARLSQVVYDSVPAAPAQPAAPPPAA